ncbi:ATP-binding protein [Thermoactinospora rubra]|uniref:ATP-binding protein n=1 Tax=Thermoactinospora rubra TaxID=1088767 RepID=UPI0013019E8E|nr:ATP-binding protein [Thermoactinospora rubra]
MTEADRDHLHLQPLHGRLADGQPALEQEFTERGLARLRSAVLAHAGELGLTEPRLSELVLAVHELATNAILHGGGHGRLRLWRHAGAIHCQVSDQGPGWDGRLPEYSAPPLPGANGGAGLWVVRRITDQLHVQSGAYGTTVTISVPLETR